MRTVDLIEKKRDGGELSTGNYLREHRFRQPYEDVNITDGQTLLEFCLDERRKELAFDDHRWFDLWNARNDS